MIRLRRPIGYVDRKTADNRVITLLTLPGRDVPVYDGGDRIGTATVTIKGRTVWADLILSRRPPSTPVVDLNTGRSAMAPHLNRRNEIDYVTVQGEVASVMFTIAPAWPYLATVPDLTLS